MLNTGPKMAKTFHHKNNVSWHFSRESTLIIWTKALYFLLDFYFLFLSWRKPEPFWTKPTRKTEIYTYQESYFCRLLWHSLSFLRCRSGKRILRTYKVFLQMINVIFSIYKVLMMLHLVITLVAMVTDFFLVLSNGQTIKILQWESCLKSKFEQLSHSM